MRTAAGGSRLSRRGTERTVRAALDVLRGRPPAIDYGLLLVIPFVAAMGGSLVSSIADAVVERRRSRSGTAPRQ